MHLFNAMLRWNLKMLGHVALSYTPGAISNSALPDAKNLASGSGGVIKRVTN